MSELVSPSVDRHTPYEAIAQALSSSGWGVFEHLLEPTLANALYQRARTLDAYQAASVGRHGDHQPNPFVRRDETAWIGRDVPIQQAWLDWVAGLRTHLNRTLMMGLHRFESHFAHYPPGAFYRRHLDAFQGEENRTLSLVCYLNPDWRPTDGGELLLYTAGGAELGRFAPTLGTVAIYLSDAFPHEVLPTQRDRYSIAGWFRPRSSLPLNNL